MDDARAGHRAAAQAAFPREARARGALPFRAARTLGARAVALAGAQEVLHVHSQILYEYSIQYAIDSTGAMAIVDVQLHVLVYDERLPMCCATRVKTVRESSQEYSYILLADVEPREQDAVLGGRDGAVVEEELDARQEEEHLVECLGRERLALGTLDERAHAAEHQAAHHQKHLVRVRVDLEVFGNLRRLLPPVLRLRRLVHELHTHHHSASA